MEGSKIKIFTVGGSIDKRYDTAMSQFVVSDPVVETLPEGVYIVMSGRVLDPIKTRKSIITDQFEL